MFAPALIALVAGATPHEVAATDRPVLPVVIVSVTDAMEMTSRTDLLRRIDAEARARADLSVELMSGTDACLQSTSIGDRFPCLARLASRDDRPNLLDEILIVSVAPGERGDRLSGVLLDADTTNEIADSTPSSELGAALRRRAIVARAEPLEATIPDDVQRFVGRLLGDDFLAAFGRTEYGTVELLLERDGYELRVDGQTLSGLGESPVTRVIRVPPGRRRIEVRHPTLLPSTTDLEVAAGAVVQWRPSGELRDSSAVVANQVVRWTGVAAVVLGVGFGAYALATEPATQPVCFTLGADCPDVGRVPRFVGVSDPPDGEPGDTNGVRYSSLAFGLGAFGLTAALTNVWLAEDERFPWLEIGLAVVAGAVGALVPYAAQ